MKGQLLNGLAWLAEGFAVLILPDAGQPSHIPASRRLRLHYGAGPEGVAAMKRQTVVEDV